MRHHTKESLAAALAKPLAVDADSVDMESFDPWEDVIHGIYGCYSSGCDELMIDALKAVRDRTTFEFIEKRGLIAELALYILAGHNLTEYGTSPRGGWPDPIAKDVWQQLIDKWEAHADIVWGKGWRD